MSFAIIQTGGKQYKVSTSEILKVERLNDEEGKTVEFKNVLFLSDNKTTEIGNPNIQGAKVEATILKNTKNKTILVFKKRRRKNSKKMYGHRQPVSLVRITKILDKNGKVVSEAGPRAKLSKEIIKAEKERSKQINEAKKVQSEEKTKIKKILQKRDTPEKKVTGNIEKKSKKKNPLTTKKKW